MNLALSVDMSEMFLLMNLFFFGKDVQVKSNVYPVNMLDLD